MSIIKVIEVTNELGLGGTGYALQLYSKYFNKELFDVTVVAIKTGGPRVKLLEDLGISVKVLNEDYNALVEILKETDVLHWHGSGSISENYKFFETVRNNRPRLVVQTNIFGIYDHHPWYEELIDYDLFVSKMILVRCMEGDKNPSQNILKKRKVLTNPVDIDLIQSLKPNYNVIESFKIKHNLKDHFIVGRLGRASDAKFDYITLDAFNEFLKLNPQSKLLMNGVTSKMRSHIQNLGISDFLVEMPNTADLAELILYYSVMDVFLACSTIGESFGMVIAEAMAVGTPVVTINTPDRDNAQIEVVDNNINGFVTHRMKKAIARSLYKLSKNPALRKQFTESSKNKIKNFYEAQKTVKSLEGLILKSLGYKTDSMVDSLILDWSNDLVIDYNLRLHKIDGKYTIIDKVNIAIGRNRIYKKLVRIKSRLLHI